MLERLTTLPFALTGRWADELPARWLEDLASIWGMAVRWPRGAVRAGSGQTA
ncbi:hypothetical protein [Streptomyces inusitatus]|uniref:hypothetical protein n=1 Tax=Streptomyces inusitatus TaxID=68221 RepID=UPI00167CC8C5|nr:hypothetical protein [Streptomyces inusitatus]